MKRSKKRTERISCWRLASRAASRGFAFALLLAACGDSGAGAAAPDAGALADGGSSTCDDGAPGRALRPIAEPTEFVGFRVERAIDRAGFLELVEPMFGVRARDGEWHDDFPIYPGMRLTTRPDERTAEQVVVELALTSIDDPGAEPVTAVRVPASFDRGELFIEGVARALSGTEALESERPGSASSWTITYHARSALGGTLRLSVRYDADSARTLLGLDATRPETSLISGAVNAPAYEGDPYEWVEYTIQLGLAYPELSYFARQLYLARASSGGQGSGRTITAPGHDWFRLHYNSTDDEGVFEVEFDLTTRDGRVISLATAPGSQPVAVAFLSGVDQLWNYGALPEAEAGGATGDFRIDFDYRDPDASGTAVVSAMVRDGRFALEYYVVTPTVFLRDVEAVPYPPVPEIEADVRELDCGDFGSDQAAQGRMHIQFKVSDILRRDESFVYPLQGDLHVGIYRAADVELMGPVDDAVAVEEIHLADFRVPREGLSEVIAAERALIAGEYHVIGFLDLNQNGDLADLNPDPGEPVIIPTTPHVLECAEQPIEVEFAIPFPEL